MRKLNPIIKYTRVSSATRKSDAPSRRTSEARLVATPKSERGRSWKAIGPTPNEVERELSEGGRGAEAFGRSRVAPALRELTAMSEFGLKRALSIIYTVVVSTPAPDLQNVLLASGGRGETKRPFLDLINACWVPPKGNPARKTALTRNSRYGRALVAAKEQGVSPQKILKRLGDRGGIEGLAASVRRRSGSNKVAAPALQSNVAVKKIQPFGRKRRRGEVGQQELERRQVTTRERAQLRAWKVLVREEHLRQILDRRELIYSVQIELTNIGPIVKPT